MKSSIASWPFSLAASISSDKDCGISIPVEIPTSGLSPNGSINASISTVITETTSRSSFLILDGDMSLYSYFCYCNLNGCENRFSIGSVGSIHFPSYNCVNTR